MVEPHGGVTARDLIDALDRWSDTGGVWRVLSRSPSRVTVALYSCDGGEEMKRLTCEDPEQLALLGDRAGSED